MIDMAQVPVDDQDAIGKHCRGLYIPPKIEKMFLDDIITRTEMQLLALIDVLAEGDTPCWAGNETLSRRIKASPDHVSRMIAKLKNLGLVVQTSFNGRSRHLETVWTNAIPMPSQSLHECRGRLCAHADSASAPMQSRDKSVEKSKENTLSSPAGLDAEREGFPSVGNNTPKNKSKKKEPTSFDRRAALELKKVIENHEPIRKSANIKSWPNQIRLMREVDEIPNDDIKMALLWYKDYIGKEYIPEIFGGKSFREKYEKLTRAMKRVGNKTETQKQNDPASTPGHADRVSRIWKYLRDGRWDLSGGPPKRLVQKAMKALGMEEGSIDFEKV